MDRRPAPRPAALALTDQVHLRRVEAGLAVAGIALARRDGDWPEIDAVPFETVDQLDVFERRRAGVERDRQAVEHGNIGAVIERVVGADRARAIEDVRDCRQFAGDRLRPCAIAEVERDTAAARRAPRRSARHRRHRPAADLLEMAHETGTPQARRTDDQRVASGRGGVRFGHGDPLAATWANGGPVRGDSLIVRRGQFALAAPRATRRSSSAAHGGLGAHAEPDADEDQDRADCRLGPKAFGEIKPAQQRRQHRFAEQQHRDERRAEHA